MYFQDAHEDAIAARLAKMMKKQGLEETFMQAFSEGGGQSHLLSPGAKMDGSRLDKVNLNSRFIQISFHMFLFPLGQSIVPHL